MSVKTCIREIRAYPDSQLTLSFVSAFDPTKGGFFLKCEERLFTYFSVDIMGLPEISLTHWLRHECEGRYRRDPYVIYFELFDDALNFFITVNKFT